LWLVEPPVFFLALVESLSAESLSHESLSDESPSDESLSLESLSGDESPSLLPRESLESLPESSVSSSALLECDDGWVPRP
jgi:hypothetical protein